MSIISRIRRRYSKDGVLGLWVALFDRLIAPLHVRYGTKDGMYLMEREGIVVDISSTSLPPLLKYRLKKGSLNYERTESEAILQHLDAETDVIELGAGIGYVSCLIDSVLEESVSQISVEANPELVSVINKNRERNNAQFHTINAAYSSTSEAISMNIYDDYRSSGMYDKSGRTGEKIRVEGVNLANLVEKYDLGEFSVVADIEGAEANMILNEWSVIENRCKAMILEFHNRNPNTPEAKSKLDNSKFDKVYSSSEVEVWVK